MLINLGLIDVFLVLGERSRKLKKVEQCPWDIINIQKGLVKTLRDMAAIKLTNDTGDVFEGSYDKELWANLDEHVLKVLSGEYKGQETEVFQAFRRGRSADDMRRSSLSLLITVQNRLSSLCNAIASNLEERIETVKTHTSTELITTMGECFDIGDMLEKDELDEDFNKKGIKSLETVLKKARYEENET